MLRQRIGRKYATVCETVALGDCRVLFTRIADPEDMTAHMEVVAGPSGPAVPRWQPYWAANWDAAWGLAHVLQDWPWRGGSELGRLKSTLQELAVLDLGCGLGLSGMAAAVRGARVTMVDAAQPALLFARLNTWPWRDRVHVRRLDWRCDRLTGVPFDLIIGSDIIYDSDDWPYLDRFWRQHLAWDGRLLLGESGRRTGALFPDWLAARGWRVQRSEVTVPQCARPLGILDAQPPGGAE